MKISARDAASFARSPDRAVLAVLVYGPDAGLVRERGESLIKAAADDPGDPFRVSELGAREINDDPARLTDEAAALTFTGGRRAVRVRGADDGLASHFKAFLSASQGEALVVVEAGDLPARSALRKAFEAADCAAALPCYRDDERSLPGLVTQILREHDLEASRDALAYLAVRLGGDRLLTRREIEKLALYKGRSDGAVTLEDAQACVGDSAALSTEDLAFAVAGGQAADAERALARSLQEGVAPVSVLRAVARHFQRLHLAAAAVERGAPVEGAVKTLRPPVFWKRAEPFKAQVRAWPPRALARALERLLDAEADCKRTGAPEETICARTLLGVAVNAPRERDRFKSSRFET